MVRKDKFNTRESALFVLSLVATLGLLIGVNTFTGNFITIDQTYVNDSSFDIEIEKESTGIVVNGVVSGTGNVKIYYIDDGEEIVLFQRNKITHNYSLLTPTNGALGNMLRYGDGTWDVDNNGIESESGVIDFSVSESVFAFEKEYLCTIWSVNGEFLCNGNAQCCAISEVERYSEDWDEDLYLHLGRYGAGFENNVSSKLVYLKISEDDVNFEESEWRDLPAKFVEDVEINAMINDDFDLGVYTLNVEVDDANVKIDNIDVNYIEPASGIVLVENTEIVGDEEYGAVLGEPVKWKKNVKIKQAQNNVVISIPNIAEEIVIKKIDNLTGGAEEIERNVPQRRSASQSSLTNEELEIEVSENLEKDDEIIIEYVTSAPYAEEREIGDKKEVTIIGPDEVHYENVLAFASLPIEVDSVDKIELNWITGGEDNVDFEAYDTDGNGLFDYIEWVVPHLSEQVYEIILITNAVELDSDKNFVRDVYDYVGYLDDNWTAVADGNYVRVVFEEALDSSNDITLYARGNGSVKVYVEDVFVMEFESIIEDGEYKIFGWTSWFL